MNPTPRPDVATDVMSPETLHAAFVRERPDIAHRDPAKPLGLPNPDVLVKQRRFTAFVWACIDALLPSATPELPKAPTEWSALQRALLVEIAETPSHLWVNELDVSNRLYLAGACRIAMIGMPMLRRYVALEPASAPERIIDGRPLWLWLRMALSGKITSDAWLGVAAALDIDERIDLAELALQSIYHLKQHWPPRPHSVAEERAATDALVEEVVPLLQQVPAEKLRGALDRLAGRVPVPSLPLVVFAAELTRRGSGIPQEMEKHLLAALLPTANQGAGRRLLEGIDDARRALLVDSLRPTPFNLNGAWGYYDLLGQDARGDMLLTHLGALTQGARPDVAARITELIAGLDAAGRAKLEPIAKGKGPNAKLVADALAKSG